MKKKLLALIAMVAMVMTMIPTVAFADGDAVAKIGTAEYNTLDAAVTAAKDGDTIEVLKDASTNGFNLDKNITIVGKNSKPTIIFKDKGIALWGKSLTFKDCKVVMEGIGSTPYDAEWKWMAICASKDASLTLDNVTMTMDGDGTASNTHAIYFCSNNKLNIQNGSKLTIKNYAQDALEWNGGDGGYNVNIIDSTFVSDKNRSGFTGTFVATIKNSKVDVINSTGNGSNGSHFEITNSTVNFNDNGAHGLSAGRLVIDNSTVNGNNNGANGIHVGSILTIKNNSKVTATGNKCTISSQWTIPGAVYVANAAGNESTIDKTSKVTIEDNQGSGILLKSGTLKVEEGTDLSIMRNKAEKLELGGGVYAMAGTSLYLPEGVKLYNNHAAKAGDDIYAVDNAVVVFPKVGSNWSLDGEPDCTDKITGWFDDSENARWKAHGNDPSKYHYVITVAGEYKAESAPIALKAAHGLTNATVEKEWKLDDGGKATDKVTVTLLQNGKEYETVDLSKENEWTHTFNNLNDSSEWTVEEKAVEGFTASVNKSENENSIIFVITNDDNKPIVDDNDNPVVDDDNNNTAIDGNESPATTENNKEVAEDGTKTGDDSNMMIFAVLMAIAAAGAAGVVVSRRRHN